MERDAPRGPPDASDADWGLTARLAFDLAPQGMVVLGRDGAIEAANPAASRILGLSVDALLGLTALDPRWQAVREDGTALAGEQHPAMVARETGRAFGPQIMGLSVPGESLPRWIDVTAVPLPGNQDGPPRVLATFVDVTALRSARAEAHERQRFLQRAEALGDIGHFLLDVRHRRVRASAGAARVYGRDGEEFPWDELRQMVLPEYRPVLDDSLAAAFAHGANLDVEYQVRRQNDGAIRDVRVVAEYEAEQQRIFGVIIDTTEYRRVERALSEQTAFARNIFNAEDAQMAVVGPDGTILDANAAWMQFGQANGVESFEAIGPGANYFTCGVAAGDDANARAALDGIKAVQAGTLPSFQMVYPCHAPGQQRWFTMRVLPITGRPATVLVSHRDETKRVMAEEALRVSEARFRLLSEHIGDVIWLVDLRTGVFEYCSPSIQRLTGHTPAEIREVGLTGSLTAASAEKVRQLMAERIPLARRDDPSSSAFMAEFDVRHRDGHLVPVEVDTRLLYGDDGSVAKLIGVSRDISERKRGEAALRASEQRFEKSFRSTPVVMSLADVRSGAFIDVNDAFCRISGWSRDEAIGRTPWELGWIDREERERVIHEATQGQLVNREVQTRARDGRVLTFLMNGDLFELDGTRFFLVAALDVTESKRAEAHRALLEQQVRHLERMDSMGRLAGGVAHDINNVLTAILTLAELEEAEAKDGTELHADLDAIVQACLRGQATVRGLLDFARADVARLELLDLNALLRDEVALLARTTLHRAQLTTEFDDALPAVRGDRAALTHVFMNICLNAMDAMPNGGVINVRTRRADDGSVIAEVVDSGVGMPPEVLAKALDPFFTTKPVGRGTGLGLSIVFGTVKAHGGTVSLASETGKGTTVTIQLPAAAPVETN